ncbi:ABC transporter permease subunit [Methanothrix sp.]|uniref:molybdate ABC transporter permease subunit n=1 Tax=Methanothrix sp. TaxID=90426 RepID=UPI0032992A68
MKTETDHIGNLAGQGRKTISVSARRDFALKAVVALLLILAIAFIALPVVTLFLKSPLDTTLRSLHDPVVIMAQVFVSSPFYIRQARTSFEDVDIALENAARTLGASRVYTFSHVILPIAVNGLISGAIMAFARSLGEFGATIMFAGNFQGRTQTMPLAIYTAMQGDLNVSLCISIILVAISFLVIFLVKTLTRGVYRRC